MNIEDTIRIELEAAVSTVPAGAPAPLEVVERRGHRRRIVARAGLVVASAAVFVAIVGVSIMIGRIGYTPDVAAPTVPPVTIAPVPEGSVMIAGKLFPVDDLVEAFDSAPMYFGQQSPSPAFDTSELGDEQALRFDVPAVADPDVLDGPTIYVGELEGVSAFVNECSTGVGITTCLWMGATSQLRADSGAFIFAEPPTQRDGPPYAAWMGVPEGTSVVTLRRDGFDLGWQRPVGGVTLMQLPEIGAYELIALDEFGTEVGAVAVSVARPATSDSTVPGSPTTTVP